MRQPKKPRKPVEPSEFLDVINEFDTDVCFDVSCDTEDEYGYFSASIEDIKNVLKQINYVENNISQNILRIGQIGCSTIKIEYIEKVKNSKFEQQKKKYEYDLLVYDEQLKKYESEIIEYDKFVKQKEQENLKKEFEITKKRLKKLEKALASE